MAPAKSTAAPFLLRDTFAVSEFVNADQIAQGLSAFSRETVALEAGRVMLSRLEVLARRRDLRIRDDARQSIVRPMAT